jgi:hypothetical protein
LLLRAAAIDEAAHDLLAEAVSKEHHRTASHEPTRVVMPRPSRPRL